MSTLNVEDSRFITQLVHARSGISLDVDKGYLLECRLGEVCRTRGLGSIAELATKLRSGCATMAEAVVEAMTTNETSFFRDGSPFDGLRETVIPELLRSRAHTRKLRFWSAASSTGQEPYSLAMTLAEFSYATAGWDINILATDLAEKVLQRAREAQYTQLEVNRGLSAPQLMRFFKKKGSYWCLDEKVRNLVEFKRLNLLSIPPALGPFDMIWCRNVLIYFDEPTKKQVLNRLVSNLAPAGYLFLGSSEVLLDPPAGVERVRLGNSGCYRKLATALSRSA